MLALLAVGIVVTAAVVAPRLLERSDTEVTTLQQRVSSVVVDLDRGDVEIVPHEDRSVRGARLERRREWVLSTPTVEHSLADGVLRLVARCPGSMPLVARCRVDHRVEVPASVAVVVRTRGGTVELGAIEGSVRVHTRGGVRAEGLAGDEVVVLSDGGEVSLVFAVAPSRVEVASGGGSVDVVVPGGPYDLDAASNGARVEVDIPVRAHAEAVITVASDGGAILLRPPSPAADRGGG